MSLVHSPYVPSLVLSGLALLVLAWVAWARRRDVRGGQALTVLAVLGAWWAGALALWVAAGSGTLGAEALRLQAAAGVLVPWALLAFALRATRLVERQGAILWGLAVPAAAFAALAFGPIGGLSLWRSLSTRAAFDGSLWVGEATVYGPLAGAFDAILIGVAVALLAVAVVRAPAPRRAPHAWTLAGVVLPAVAAAVVGLGAAVAPNALPAVLALLPPAAFLLAPAALAVAHGLFGDERTRAGEATDERSAAGTAAATVAAGTRRRELVDHLEQPVLWLDGASRVRYANAAAGLLFRREAGLLGEPAEALFRDLPAMLAALLRRRRAVLEIELSRATGRLRYEAWLTPLLRAQRTARRDAADAGRQRPAAPGGGHSGGGGGAGAASRGVARSASRGAPRHRSGRGAGAAARHRADQRRGGAGGSTRRALPARPGGRRAATAHGRRRLRGARGVAAAASGGAGGPGVGVDLGGVGRGAARRRRGPRRCGPR